MFRCKLKTSEYSKLSEGTKIDLRIMGKFGETDKIKLNNFPSDNEKEKFVSNNLDIFKFDSPLNLQIISLDLFHTLKFFQLISLNGKLNKINCFKIY